MAHYANERGEPVPENMPLRVQEAYGQIIRLVETTRTQRRYIAWALDQMHSDLTEDLY